MNSLKIIVLTLSLHLMSPETMAMGLECLNDTRWMLLRFIFKVNIFKTKFQNKINYLILMLILE